MTEHITSIKYHIEPAIHANYNQLYFFTELMRVAEKSVGKIALWVIDTPNPHLFEILAHTNISLTSKISNLTKGSILYQKEYKDKALADFDTIFIYDPLGKITNVQFYNYRMEIRDIYYLTTPSDFGLQLLNHVTSNDRVFLNESILLDRNLCLTMSKLFPNTRQAFLKLFNYGIENQSWFDPDGYLVLKREEKESVQAATSILSMIDNKWKLKGKFISDNIIPNQDKYDIKFENDNKKYKEIIDNLQALNNNIKNISSDKGNVEKILQNIGIIETKIDNILQKTIDEATQIIEVQSKEIFEYEEDDPLYPYRNPMTGVR